MAKTSPPLFAEIFSAMAADRRISVWHLGIYMSLYYQWLSGGMINPVAISRKQIMSQTHIGSIVTYHKCIRQLSEYGYIRYQPSYNPFTGSTISLLVPATLDGQLKSKNP